MTVYVCRCRRATVGVLRLRNCHYYVMHECVANMGAVTHNIMPKQNAVLFVPEVFLLGHSACVCPVSRAVLRSGLLTYTHDTSIYDRSLAHKY